MSVVLEKNNNLKNYKINEEKTNNNKNIFSKFFNTIAEKVSLFACFCFQKISNSIYPKGNEKKEVKEERKFRIICFKEIKKGIPTEEDILQVEKENKIRQSYHKTISKKLVLPEVVRKKLNDQENKQISHENLKKLDAEIIQDIKDKTKVEDLNISLDRRQKPIIPLNKWKDEKGNIQTLRSKFPKRKEPEPTTASWTAVQYEVLKRLERKLLQEDGEASELIDLYLLPREDIKCYLKNKVENRKFKECFRFEAEPLKKLIRKNPISEKTLLENYARLLCIDTMNSLNNPSIKEKLNLDVTDTKVTNLDEAIEKLNLIIEKNKDSDLVKDLEKMRALFQKQKNGTITCQQKDKLRDITKKLRQ